MLTGKLAATATFARWACLLFLWLSIGQCSATVKDSGNATQAAYALDRVATNIPTNSLSLALSTTEGYTFSLTGDGFTADVALGKRLPLQPAVTLNYTTEGMYELILTVYQSDGSIVIHDTLHWQYSTEVPPDPIVTFSEAATNDDSVLMLVALNKGANTQELGVAGDLAGTDFAWLPIPDTGIVPVTVSAQDGIKDFSVKYRNIFGTESRTTLDLSILKKSIGPTNCSVTIDATTTASRTARLQISADNDGDLYYLAVGDVKSTGEFTKFSRQTVANVELLGDGPQYKMTVQVRDVAENYCPSTPFTITYDPNHTTESIQIENQPLWTDEPVVTVEPQMDHLGSDTAEMYVHGDIQPSATTFQWIPFQSHLPVQLSPVDGNRFVRVKYRLNGVESVVRSAAIYLSPFLRIQGSGVPYTLEFSNIIGMTAMTIAGCSEPYNHIPYQATLPCSPTGSSVNVTYFLSDGTQLTRTALVH